MQTPLICWRGRNVGDLAGALAAYRLAATMDVDRFLSPDGAPPRARR